MSRVWQKIIENRCIFYICFLLAFVVFIVISKLPHSTIPQNQKEKEVKNSDRFIHQSWKTKEIPEDFQNITRTWSHSCFKGWHYMFWTDVDNYNFIKSKFSWFLPAYEKLEADIYKADVCRYFYLYEYGGIYTDIDNECLRPFEHLLDGYSLVFGSMKGQFGGTSLKEGYVQNSFMYSKPEHPFWMGLIKLIQKKIVNNEFSRPEDLTGPIVLSNFIQKQRSSGILKAAEIKIYTPEYFNPFSWLKKEESPKECKDSNRMTQKERKVCRNFFYKKGSFVLQYHAHTWG